MEPIATQLPYNGKAPVGTKRGLGTERPAHPSKAFAPPGARLLSSAVMQSLQSVRDRASSSGGGEGLGSGTNGVARGGVGASGGAGGEKRRKSGDGSR